MNRWIYKQDSSIWGWINIKMSSCQYRKSLCGDKTILRPSYLHNGISYTGKTASLYWIKALACIYLNPESYEWPQDMTRVLWYLHLLWMKDDAGNNLSCYHFVSNASTTRIRLQQFAISYITCIWGCFWGGTINIGSRSQFQNISKSLALIKHQSNNCASRFLI